MSTVKRVAILGSKGFVGSHIANEAARRGWHVNHIGSRTINRAELLHESDAVVHSVGSFMADKRYKTLVSQPVSVKSLAKLAKMRLGLDPPSPLQPKGTSMEDINYGTVKETVDLLLQRDSLPESSARIPFVFLSAANWELADPTYVATKRRAEQLLASHPEFRSIFLRPGLIAPPRARYCSEVTPRHLVDLALTATNSKSRVSVHSIAIAACDAIEFDSFEGVIECDVLRELDSLHPPSFS